jgi:hypothetical protein
LHVLVNHGLRKYGIKITNNLTFVISNKSKILQTLDKSNAWKWNLLDILNTMDQITKKHNNCYMTKLEFM